MNANGCSCLNCRNCKPSRKFRKYDRASARAKEQAELHNLIKNENFEDWDIQSQFLLPRW